MKRSELFSKTFRAVSGEETSRNAQLLTRGGFIHKQMAGVYVFLPLGLRVLEKIKGIIREEMNAIGGQEILMTALQNPEVWEATGRWDSEKIDVWFKTRLATGHELGLAPTHEEPLTQMMRSFVSSYKDLPVFPYQFQTKFRNELRSKSGLLRGREFLMKDLYSFSRDEEEHAVFYEKATEAYYRVFERLGLGELTYKTFASGGSFSKYSHEFQTVSEVGEDTIFLAREKKLAINKEVLTAEVMADLGVKKGDLEEVKAVEVGNIFTLGYKFSEALDLKFTDHDGKSRLVFMGCYGIGPSRVMGLIAETFADEKGLVWPENIAPFQVYLVGIGGVEKEAEELYEELTKQGVEVLFDDRKDASVGEKMADFELLGIPNRVVVSKKLVESGKMELQKRTEDSPELLTKLELFGRLKARC